MSLRFEPLDPSHFPLMLKWLESPHVKQWWDPEKTWTLSSVQEKYTDYTQGYKTENSIKKPITARVIYYDEEPIGYIQGYNAYDFSRSVTLDGLPKSLGGFDIFIGEKNYLGKNLGAQAIRLFLEQILFPVYTYVFSDPEYTNAMAVSAYQKSGFTVFKRVQNLFWMLAWHKKFRISIAEAVALECAFTKYFQENDRLWIFGSRTDLQKKGGDIDLYIETYATSAEAAYQMKVKFLSAFSDAIGEQKIDLVLNIMNSAHTLPIYEIAKKEGINIL
jgi:aminoglycoside 6'-N-acetyltransferase